MQIRRTRVAALCLGLSIIAAGQAAGHIPDAINIPRGVLEFRIWSRLDAQPRPAGEIELYLYCGWGSRALLAAGSLQQLGLGRVVAVDMTLADWQAAGLPFTKP